MDSIAIGKGAVNRFYQRIGAALVTTTAVAASFLAASAAPAQATLANCVEYTYTDPLGKPGAYGYCTYGTGQYQIAVHCFRRAPLPSYWLYGEWHNASTVKSITHCDNTRDTVHSFHLSYRNE